MCWVLRPFVIHMTCILLLIGDVSSSSYDKLPPFAAHVTANPLREDVAALCVICFCNKCLLRVICFTTHVCYVVFTLLHITMWYLLYHTHITAHIHYLRADVAVLCVVYFTTHITFFFMWCLLYYTHMTTHIHWRGQVLCAGDIYSMCTRVV